MHEPDSLTYWHSKPDIKDDVTSTVDWEAIEKSLQRSKRARRVFITKHVAGMCGVGKFMLRWRQWDTDQCPRCGEREDAPHVWTCKEKGANDVGHGHLRTSKVPYAVWIPTRLSRI